MWSIYEEPLKFYDMLEHDFLGYNIYQNSSILYFKLPDKSHLQQRVDIVNSIHPNLHVLASCLAQDSGYLS